MTQNFSKYFATFQTDPLNKSVGLKGVNPKSWNQFGPIKQSGGNYIEYTQEPSQTSAVTPGGNSYITDIGFDFQFNGTTYNKFIASPHGWVALLDPTALPTSSLDIVYNDRLLASGSSSYVNSAIKSAFNKNDVLLAPWFDRLLMKNKDLDSFTGYYSGSSDIETQYDNFLYGKIDASDQPYDELEYGMKYALLDDSIEGKTLAIRWSSLGYEYRNRRLDFETVLYKNGKIEFNYAPLGSYSTDYTLVGLSYSPTNVWKLDESSGLTVDDAKNSKDLTYKTGSLMQLAEGIIGTAANFSGSSEFQNSDTLIYADQPSFANYSATDSFSFSAWFKCGVIGDSSVKTIVSRMYYDYSKGYSFELSGGYLQLTLAQSFNTNVLRVASVANTYNDGQWYHVVVTYDGTASSSSIKIYVDGEEISTTAAYTSLTTSSDIQASSAGADFLIGAIGKYNNGINTNHFTGSIDDVARWNSKIGASDASLIYENGLLGISVADIGVIGDSSTSYATCGIFASGSSTWNYRDFASLLGSSSINRMESDFGGYLYSNTFTETDIETSIVADYGVNIGIDYWPKNGGRITFSPPKDLIKTIKSDVYKYESSNKLLTVGFDDRKSIDKIQQYNVNAQTVIPLNYLVKSTFPGVHLKQNLYKNDGINFATREVTPEISSFFLQDDLQLTEKSAPFIEENLFDQDSSDPFFSISAIPPYVNSLKKKQISLNFPVNKKVKLFPSASSLYYYNVKGKQWNLPHQTLKDQVSSSFDKLSVRTTDQAGTCNGSFYLEDHIGFDSQGNNIASGSLNIFRSTTSGVKNQSTLQIGQIFKESEHIDLVSPEFSKSIHRNSDYDATNDELFTLPITDPFFIEKAIINLPFCLGNSWFEDRTTYLLASASNFAFTSSGGSISSLPSFTWYEEGGPSITVSLFCQKKHKQGYVRDLILKSTFTHVDDRSNSLKFYHVNSGSNNFIHAVSVLGNNHNPNAISASFVQYEIVESRKQFTGSVVTKAVASFTNCANVGIVKSFNMSNYATSGSMLADFFTFLDEPSFSIANNTTHVLSIDAFGRAMSGFGADSSGETLTTLDFFTTSSINNPFYFNTTTAKQNVTSSLESQFASYGTGSYLYCIAKSPLGKQKLSAYLVNPEDKLILAVSKSRPAYKSADIRISTNSLDNGKINSVVSSSYFNEITYPYGHDVYFNTGSINITLYGSQIKLGQEV